VLPELQTWSTAVSVDAVLEGQVRCVVGSGSGSLASIRKDLSCRCGGSSRVGSADAVANGY